MRLFFLVPILSDINFIFLPGVEHGLKPSESLETSSGHAALSTKPGTRQTLGLVWRAV
jgi:hypothetical protein